MGTTARPARFARPYTLGEEIANSLIHGLGIGLSVAALTLLVVFAVQNGDGWQLAASIVYGVTLVLEYTASTLYHSFPQPDVKHVFKILDHAGIYLLIAGTYTPFTLVTLRDSGGWWLFALVWVMAIAGVSAEAAWVYRPRWVSAAVYLAMGWLVVLAIRPLIANLEPAGLWLLVAGGAAYTVGTIFYVLKRIPYMHAVWHVFVLIGSICHFLAVLLFVL
ncbi:MAG: hemolysin III family protein [Actinomycetota bacterium]|jgi:hemolysin III|nr:hemolysin III family protein [Actinomycetota bacterium]MDZ4178840.1 hemolysin III family protein [Coriobacteriia bacterium]